MAQYTITLTDDESTLYEIEAETVEEVRATCMNELETSFHQVRDGSREEELFLEALEYIINADDEQLGSGFCSFRAQGLVRVTVERRQGAEEFSSGEGWELLDPSTGGSSWEPAEPEAVEVAVATLEPEPSTMVEEDERELAATVFGVSADPEDASAEAVPASRPSEAPASVDVAPVTTGLAEAEVAPVEVQAVESEAAEAIASEGGESVPSEESATVGELRQQIEASERVIQKIKSSREKVRSSRDELALRVSAAEAEAEVAQAKAQAAELALSELRQAVAQAIAVGGVEPASSAAATEQATSAKRSRRGSRGGRGRGAHAAERQSSPSA